jgi:hypothetical protein
MRGARFVGLMLIMGLVLGNLTQALAQKEDATRDVFLQTIGLLAGQGLVVGHENLEGIFGRYEKRQLPKDKALLALAAARRYVELVMTTFSGRLMGQLTEQEKQDLKMLIGFYEVQRGAILALTDYVRLGGPKNRQAFDEMQARVAAIIHQITLPAGHS